MNSVMKNVSAGVVGLCLMAIGAFTAPTDDVYLLGPDSQPHPGVPQGKIIGPATLPSNIFTNTTRNYWVYVPAQYDPAKPACLMIFEDGHAYMNLNGEYRIPYVFDNLIYRREMPVTIAVFVNPGHHPGEPEPTDSDWGDRSGNRRLEYNALDDKYARLTIEELLPVISKQYNISPDPENRAIAGASSGAICAFTVAWQRPDQFRKVISCIGSFTAILGGDAYPEMILTNDAKPIRIFLQDGLNDNRGVGRGGGAYNPARDWHGQNIKMVEALTAKKYDVNYVWGIGTHSHKQGGAIMPEMLRWLWRDYPRPDDPKDGSNRSFFVPADMHTSTTNAPAHATTIQGKWKPATAELAGQPMPEAVLKSISLKLDNDKYEVFVGVEPDRGTYLLDSTSNPKGMVITGTEGPNLGKTFPAIYELKGDTLRICYDLSGAKRPTEFKTAAGTRLYLVMYNRVKD